MTYSFVFLSLFVLQLTNASTRIFEFKNTEEKGPAKMGNFLAIYS